MNLEIINGTNIIPDGVAVALGAFDGIHIGHKKLIDNIIEYSKQEGCKTCVFTFDVLPSGAKSIITHQQRNDILADMGVDYLYIQHFDASFKNMTASEFMSRYLLQAKFVSVGFNFRFGVNRQGDTLMLEEFCKQNHIEFCIEKPVLYDGQVVSSTLIRKAIGEADIARANAMLGRPFCAEGVVVHGEALGRTLGFPTANVQIDSSMIVPCEGVYVTVTQVEDVLYKSFTNYGSKPTFENDKVLLETHLFDFDDDLYGKTIKVYFMDKLRGVTKFSSVEALVEQLLEDKTKSLNFFSKNGLQM